MMYYFWNMTSSIMQLIKKLTTVFIVTSSSFVESEIIGSRIDIDSTSLSGTDTFTTSSTAFWPGKPFTVDRTFGLIVTVFRFVVMLLSWLIFVRNRGYDIPDSPRFPDTSISTNSFICLTLSSPLIRSVHSDHCGMQFPCPSSICDKKSEILSSVLTQSRTAVFCKSRTAELVGDPSGSHIRWRLRVAFPQVAEQAPQSDQA